MRLKTYIACACLTTLLGIPSLGVHAGEQPSDAEVLLFETNHLKKISKPTALHYSFKKEGTLEQGFDDSVAVNIDRVEKDGTKHITTNYLTGNRKKNFPGVEHAEGNPVLLYFLERDITEMERLTGGKRPYFQKRIRLALADRAEVRPVTFAYNGKTVSGTEIKVSPYVDNPMKARFEKFSGKYYLFTLSDEVPGGVYQVRAVIPDSTAAETAREKKSLIEETLTFSNAGEPRAKK